MSPRPSIGQRRQVVRRASGRCEYCLVHHDDAYAAFQIDHIIAEKHGGTTTLENLALSCLPCNRRKGSDISSIDPLTGQMTPLFNPRTQRWHDHFMIEGPYIRGRTSEGRATVMLLRLNSDERVLERAELLKAGRFPIP